MNRIVDNYCRLLNGVLAVLLAIMVALVFGNVVLRYLFNSGWTVSEELSRWAFVWVVFLGSVVALRDGTHLGSDLVTRLLPAVGRQVCYVASRLLMLFVAWLLLDGSWQQASLNTDVAAPTTGLPMAVVYAAGVVFAASALLLIALDLLRVLGGAPLEPEHAEAGTPHH